MLGWRDEAYYNADPWRGAWADGTKVANITSPRINLAARQTPPNSIDRVPYIPMLRENNVRKGFFEHGDFLSLHEALPDYMKGFVTFAYKTGWRVSEIEGLTWAQFRAQSPRSKKEGSSRQCLTPKP